MNPIGWFVTFPFYSLNFKKFPQLSLSRLSRFFFLASFFFVKSLTEWRHLQGLVFSLVERGTSEWGESELRKKEEMKKSNKMGKQWI